MCIVLLTTGHPEYALIVINNRDEFIVRPTSRPHWWTPSSPAEGQQQQQQQLHKPPEILSSRDLNRSERGTWLGITRTGRFACLTNYREPDCHDAAHPVHGLRSRGAIVSAWLGGPDPAEATPAFVQRMLSPERGGVKGVGGFSLICGLLRRQHKPTGAGGDADDRNIAPLAVISNRSEHPDRVPWIASSRDETHGLSNAAFDDDAPPWPKVQRGKALLDEAVARWRDSSPKPSEDDLVASLLAVLDADTLPRQPEDAPFESYIPVLKHTIFVPPLGGEQRRLETEAFGDAARQHALASTERTSAAGKDTPPPAAAETTPVGSRPDEQVTGFMTGLYGTQRQTVILVGWDGSVRYTERALWDEYGRSVPRGEGDMTFRFEIEGWNDDIKEQRIHHI